MSFIQYLVSLIIILNPITALPAYLLLWPHQSSTKNSKTAYKIAGNVVAILCISYLFGNWLLQIIGLDIVYFKITGGIVIGRIGRGFITGTSSLLKLGQRHQAQNEGTILIPLAMPMIAGPGSISFVISHSQELGLISSIAAITISSGVVYIVLRYGYQIISHISYEKIGLITKLVGMLLLGIGLQTSISSLIQLI